MKRFKSEDNCFREELALGTNSVGDLYAGHEHTSMPAQLLTDFHPDIKQEKQEHVSI